MLNYSRTHPQGRHRPEVEDAIRKLDVKLHEAMAYVEEKRRKRELSIDDSIPMGDAKRLKTSNDTSDTPRKHRPVDPSILSNFDFSTVPRPVLVEIIVESLKLLSEEQLQDAIEVCLVTYCVDLGTDGCIEIQSCQFYRSNDHRTTFRRDDGGYHYQG